MGGSYAYVSKEHRFMLAIHVRWQILGADLRFCNKYFKEKSDLYIWVMCGRQGSLTKLLGNALALPRVLLLSNNGYAWETSVRKKLPNNGNLKYWE